MKKISTSFFLVIAVTVTTMISLSAQVPVLVKDINPSGNSSYPIYMTAIGNKVYFNANDGSTGEELWVSDGNTNANATGTYRIADINPGQYSSSPKNLIEVGGKLFFSATDPTHGEELWVYDPLTNDTSFLKDIYIGTNGSNISNMFDFNGTLYFTAVSAAEGNELWKSDGTPSGTLLVSNINPGSQHAFQPGFPAYFTVIGNYLYFVASDNLVGKEIFRTDGTTAGTSLYVNIDINNSSSPQDLVAVGSTLYCRAVTNQNGGELFKVNTNTGTWSIVKDINSTSISAFYLSYNNPLSYKMVNLSDTLFFVANDGASGFGDELWMTTGYDSTTHRISDISPGSGDAQITELSIYNGKVYFAASNASYGNELYRTNGFPVLSSSSPPFGDIVNGPNGSGPGQFVEMNGELFFVTSSLFNVLYKTDGVTRQSINGQQFVSNLCATTSALFFQSYDNINGYELWKLDATTTTGITENNLTVVNYPNPTTGFITFTSTTPINQIEIYSITGLQLQQQTINQTLTEQLDLSNFEAGIYLAVITTHEGRITQRILKQ